MADEQTPGETPKEGATGPQAGDTSSAPQGAATADNASAKTPAKEPKVWDEKTVQAHVISDINTAQRTGEARAAAIKAAGDNAEKREKVREKFNKKRDKFVQEVEKKLGNNEKNTAAYDAFEATHGEAIGEALKKADTLTKASLHFAEHSGKYALGGAAVALAAAMLPSKEVQKEDGTTEKKSGFFKKAVVALGAILAVGAAVNKFQGGGGGWAGKLAAERVAKAAGIAAAGAART